MTFLVFRREFDICIGVPHLNANGRDAEVISLNIDNKGGSLFSYHLSRQKSGERSPVPVHYSKYNKNGNNFVSMRKHEEIFRNVSKIAQRILGIPPTQMDNERVSSFAWIVMKKMCGIWSLKVVIRVFVR